MKLFITEDSGKRLVFKTSPGDRPCPEKDLIVISGYFSLPVLPENPYGEVPPK